MSQVLFYAVTSVQFNALETKNPNAVYFVTDANRIYKGAAPYTHPVATVSAFPATGEAGTLYIHQTTFEARTWSGSAWVKVSPPVATAIGASPTHAQLPTALAVKNYVDAEIVNVNSGLSGAVSDVAYNAAAKSISVQKGAGEAVVTALSGLFDGVGYNGATGVLSFTTNGGTPVSVNLPVEQFLAAASYDQEMHVLTLALNDGTEFTVNLADLVDAYTGGSTGTAVVSVSGGAITASVKISAAEGNLIGSDANGVYATLEWQTL